ncbi:hypothetical protein RIEGSTA812A_PEG_1130 [invertebrate metagenome]|uniref:Uncharacterized protein n=1 Tax=invertebrate metagenome TaxID=1711999 RepID=A0A484H6A3_9ZZZZ
MEWLVRGRATLNHKSAPFLFCRTLKKMSLNENRIEIL